MKNEIVCPLCGAFADLPCIRGRYPGHKFDLENPLEAPHYARVLLIQQHFDAEAAGITAAIKEMNSTLRGLSFSLNQFNKLYKENN